MSQKANSESSHFIDEALSFEVEVTCDNFELQVNQVLDRRESPRNDPRLNEHVADCQACRRVLQEYVSVDDSLKLLKGDIDQILAKAGQKRTPLPRHRFRTFASIALAAVLILAGLYLLPDRPAPSPSKVAMVAASLESKADAEAEKNLDPKLLNNQRVMVDHTTTVPPRSVEADESLERFVRSGLDVDLGAAFAHQLQGNVNLNQRAIRSIFSRFESLEPVFRYSTEFPGLHPMRGTFNMAIQFLRQSFQSPDALLNPRHDSGEPDLGRRFGPGAVLASA